MSDIAWLCLLCGIGADNHLKKTAGMCKKIAKSFVKGYTRRSPRPKKTCASSFDSTRLRAGLICQQVSAGDKKPRAMLTSCYGHDVGN
jgi:hypothetical protein